MEKRFLLHDEQQDEAIEELLLKLRNVASSSPGNIHAGTAIVIVIVILIVIVMMMHRVRKTYIHPFLF